MNDRDLETALRDRYLDRAGRPLPLPMRELILAVPTQELARERVGRRAGPRWTRFRSILALAAMLVVAGTLAAWVGSSPLLRPSPIPADHGVFTPTGSMAMGRAGATATMLLDGRVLVVGGTASTIAEIWDPATNTFSPAGTMSDRGRDFHSATRLLDGRVLIAGGRNPPHPFSRASAEIFDPATMTFTAVAPPAVDRYGGRAMLLADGRVLVVGSFGDPMRDPEVYDPATDSWGPAGSLPEASYPPGTLLSDGRVLVISEDDGSATVWDPATGASSPAGRLAQPRGGHTATLLADGRVLITGGNLIGPGQCVDPSVPARPHGSCEGGGVNTSSFLATAEIWDPATMTFQPTGAMGQARFQHAAALLGDGRVLIIGGNRVGSDSAEVFALR